MSDWLELELAHHLAPVEAPPALVFERPAPRPSRRSFTLAPVLAAAAAVALVLLAAPQQHTNPLEINRYFRAQAGIDLPIPANTAAHIEGARVMSQGESRIAAVTYRSGGREGTVLIARASTVRGSEWKPHGQIYAIACAEPQIACVLCHANL